jgi:hypothetical protein
MPVAVRDQIAVEATASAECPGRAVRLVRDDVTGKGKANERGPGAAACQR